MARYDKEAYFMGTPTDSDSLFKILGMILTVAVRDGTIIITDPVVENDINKVLTELAVIKYAKIAAENSITGAKKCYEC